MKVKSENEVSQSCPTLSDPVDCNPPGSSIHGIFHGEEKVKSENCNHFQTNHGLAECGLKQGTTMKHPFAAGPEAELSDTGYAGGDSPGGAEA